MADHALPTHIPRPVTLPLILSLLTPSGLYTSHLLFIIAPWLSLQLAMQTPITCKSHLLPFNARLAKSLRTRGTAWRDWRTYKNKKEREQREEDTKGEDGRWRKRALGSLTQRQKKKHKGGREGPYKSSGPKQFLHPRNPTPTQHLSKKLFDTPGILVTLHSQHRNRDPTPQTPSPIALMHFP